MQINIDLQQILYVLDAFNPLSINPKKWSNTLRQFVGLVLKGLTCIVASVFCMIGIHFLSSQITFSWFIPEFLFFVYIFKFSAVSHFAGQRTFLDLTLFSDVSSIHSS